MTPTRCIIPLGKSERDCGCNDAHSETPQFIKEIAVHQHHFVIETTEGEEISVRGDNVYPDLIRYLPVYIGFIESGGDNGNDDNGDDGNGAPTMLIKHEGAPLSLVTARQLLVGLHEEMREPPTQPREYAREYARIQPRIQPRMQPRMHAQAQPSHEQLRRSAVAKRLTHTSNRSVGFASELITTDVDNVFDGTFDNTFNDTFNDTINDNFNDTFDDNFNDMFDGFNIDDNYIKYNDDFWNHDNDGYANRQTTTEPSFSRSFDQQTRDRARARIIAQLREQARHTDVA